MLWKFLLYSPVHHWLFPRVGSVRSNHRNSWFHKSTFKQPPNTTSSEIPSIPVLLTGIMCFLDCISIKKKEKNSHKPAIVRRVTNMELEKVFVLIPIFSLSVCPFFSFFFLGSPLDIGSITGMYCSHIKAVFSLAQDLWRMHLDWLEFRLRCCTRKCYPPQGR